MDKIIKVKINSEDCVKKLVGNYIILWRNNIKTACRVDSIDKENQSIQYTLITGRDKGKRYQSMYIPTQEVKVYDEGSVILAAMEI